VDIQHERIELLKVPIDIVSGEALKDLVFELLQEGSGKNIVLLSLWDLMRARHNPEYRDYVMNAALVIPISKSLVRGAHFLCGKQPERYMPFNFILSLLTILEDREFSVYLLGGQSKVLTKTEKHIRETFPHLRIIGRFPGYFKKQNEEVLIQVIRKSAPSLLLVNKGVPRGEKWIAKNSAKLSPGLRLWCSDIFDVFSARRKRPSNWIFERGLDWIGLCLQNPLYCFRVFTYLYYNILLLFSKLRRRPGRLSPAPSV
jgi:N-acetylglucosaminyldiphosphoundecaprenol N-acetyl-beta-D-mannosaminyltransferase